MTKAARNTERRRRRSKKKIREERRYDPSGPGNLNTENRKAWEDYREAHRGSDGRVDDVKALFKSFKKSANFIKPSYTKPPVSPKRRPKVSITKTLLRGVKDGLIDSLDGKVERIIVSLKDKQVGRLVTACRSEIGKKNTPREHVEKLERFLAQLRPLLLRRGKPAWQAIGEEDYFEWPSTDVFEELTKSAVDGRDWQKDGLLSAAGYTVGESSELTASGRMERLRIVFETDFTHYVPSLGSVWGPPATAKRLKKMANSIAAFTRNAKRRRHDNYKKAIEHWEADLDFLYREYYRGYFDFGWPVT